MSKSNNALIYATLDGQEFHIFEKAKSRKELVEKLVKRMLEARK